MTQVTAVLLGHVGADTAIVPALFWPPGVADGVFCCKDATMPDDVPTHAAHLMDGIQKGPIRTGWHWLGYNFTPGSAGFVTVGGATVLALAQVDALMPGFAEEQVTRLEAMGGAEKNIDHYAQIVSWYAELLVNLKLAEHRWPAPAAFLMEPTAGDSNFNPEVVVELDGVGSLGVEVKAPNLLEHSKTRSTNPWQLTGRTEIGPAVLEGAVTLPRDNPVKDFLVHANKKFAGFRAADPDFRSILVIVWDDFVNEPVTALLSSSSGLLTTSSFHRENGKPVGYPNVDAILLVRHQHQIVRALGGEALVDDRSHLLDFGRQDGFPPHALVTNPVGKQIPAAFLACLGAVPIEVLSSAAEYNPGELVIWQ